MYFDSRMSEKRGLPWTDSRSSFEKGSDEYFEALEALVAQVDDIEADTTFMTDLSPDEFDSGYEYAKHRVRELRQYLKRGVVLDHVDMEDCLDQLADIEDELENMEGDAILYDDFPGDDDDFDDDLDWDDDDDDDSDDW